MIHVDHLRLANVLSSVLFSRDGIGQPVILIKKFEALPPYFIIGCVLAYLILFHCGCEILRPQMLIAAVHKNILN